MLQWRFSPRNQPRKARDRGRCGLCCKSRNAAAGGSQHRDGTADQFGS
jgi:hypothetical protein